LAGTWTVDSSTLVALRLREADKALNEGRLDHALIEAEELLDEQPSHQRALEIVSQAALGMGDVVMALEALNRFVELHNPGPRVLQTLAVARFEAVDFAGALAAAEQATGLDSRMAPAWYYQGLALERIGKPATAKSRFKRAADLDPTGFPIPLLWEDLPWAKLLDDAMDATPQPIQVFFDGVPITWADFPAIEDLLENYPPLSPFTDAMYRGQPPEDGDPWVYRPTQVTLFQGNLSRPSHEPEDLVRRITEALMHEAMHWLGVMEMA
jgi:tetratricopeptide (TPR) repeat protein